MGFLIHMIFNTWAPLEKKKLIKSKVFGKNGRPEHIFLYQNVEKFSIGAQKYTTATRFMKN